MTRPAAALSPPAESFFQRLARADARVLMLDYDGTLAPFRVRPADARPYRGVAQAIRDMVLEGHTRIVIVSGRALGELAGLLDVDPLPELWGSHGWEQRTAAGSYERMPVPEAVDEALGLAVHRADEAGLRDWLEVKPVGVALHWRGRSQALARSAEAWGRTVWRPLAQDHGLELKDFDGGVELRAAGRDKGTAVRTVLAESPCDAIVAYLGDDLTDEDAFRALPSNGLAVLVRRKLRPTAAGAWIRPPGELLSFLERWKSAAEGKV